MGQFARWTRASGGSAAFVAALFLVAPAAAAEPAFPGSEAWAGYLDYAYVYSSADATELEARFATYSKEAGLSLEDWVARTLATARLEGDALDETATRRLAIAQLLLYLSQGDPLALDASVARVQKLEDRLARHENAYWFHYVLAHRALEKGRRFDFSHEVLALWLDVVVPLEGPFESLQVLSLSESPNSGFVSALPYVYENVSRLVLIRTQQMGLDRDLDPMGAIVRLLHDGRVGAYPEIIPLAASSKDYVDRILERLDGPESDDGSLTFTLALFEAGRYHERARGLLASEGLGEETVKAIHVATGAYEKALFRADTVQGQAAVYTRVLRQLGEIYAAKQRLGVDPEIETPFSLEGAVEVYASLYRELQGDWRQLGYRSVGRAEYLDAMHRLWEEIQEASLNAGDYYLTRSAENPQRAAQYARNAARTYARYLSFFHEFATPEAREAVPASAYFAAYEAGRGFGDAYLGYGTWNPTPEEVDLATRHYANAIRIFPFDRSLWPAFTAGLGRQGRESEFTELVRPVAEAVTRSRHVDRWIERKESGAEQIASMRRALNDSQVVLYLGFADSSRIEELEQNLEDLRARRDEVGTKLRQLSGEGSPKWEDAVPASMDEGAASEFSALGRFERQREIAELNALLTRLDAQLAARERALPLYRNTLGSDGLAAELRARRDHPVHTLLRRMYDENRS